LEKLENWKICDPYRPTYSLDIHIIFHCFKKSMYPRNVRSTLDTLRLEFVKYNPRQNQWSMPSILPLAGPPPPFPPSDCMSTSHSEQHIDIGCNIVMSHLFLVWDYKVTFSHRARKMDGNQTSSTQEENTKCYVGS